MQRINEKSTSYLNVSFRDKEGALAVPTSISYRIDCVTTGTAVLAPTALAAASEVEITITPTQNAIVTSSNATEQKRVTVTAVYGASDQVTSQFDYLVKNLSGVP